MKAETLKDALRRGPTRVKMNNGDVIEVAHSEFMSVGDYTAALLVRSDGVARHRIVSLINISDVEILPAVTDAETE